MKTSFDFEQVMKQSKRKNRLKVVAISTLTTLVSLGVLGKVFTEVTSANGRQVEEQYRVMTEIALPNVYYSSAYYEPLSHFHGIYRSDRFKNLHGIRVNFEGYEARYSLLGSQHPYSRITFDQHAAYTRKDNLKVPVFYNSHRQVTSQQKVHQPTQDLKLLSQMPNHVVEVAVTFDKPYTIAEIKKMLPENLTAAWYWIGTQTDIDTSLFDISEQIGFDLVENVPLPAADEEKLQSSQLKMGFQKAYEKAVKEAGPLTEEKNIHNNYTFFQKYAQTALDKGFLGSSITDINGVDWSLKEDVKAYLKQYPDGNSAKFSGIIITGVSDDFAQIEEATWVFASSIGQSTPIMPYHKLGN